MARAVVEGTRPAFERVILPREFAEQIVDKSPEGVKLYVLEDCLIAEGEGITFYSNLLDVSDSDDMAAIVARQLKEHPDPVPLPAGLDGALSRAAILAGKEPPTVSVTITKGTLVLFGDYGMGTLNETLKLEGAPEEASLRLRVDHLKRALPNAENFSLTDATLLLYGEPGFTYVIAAQ